MLREIMVFCVRFVLVFVASVLLVFGSCTGFYVFGATESEAVGAVAAAGEKIVLCYDAVAEADAAGANVTALLARLGEAGELFSNAELAVGVGDFDSAVDLAGQSQIKLDGFAVEAEALTEEAIQEKYFDFLFVAGSGVGAVGVVCGGFVAWRLMKRREEVKEAGFE